MSLTFSLVCDDTRQKVWVGQGHHNEHGEPIMEAFYSGEPETMAALGRFLNQTRGKALRLVVDDYPENARTYEYTTP